jgi:hypothetical protein
MRPWESIVRTFSPRRFTFAPATVSAVMVLALALAGQALAGTVTITSPASGAVVSTSIHVTASATATSTVSPIQIYLDGKKVYEVGGSKLDTTITTGTGSHRLTVQAYANGTSFKNTINVTVGSADSGGGSTSTAKQFSNIDEMTGWGSCDGCAGAGGVGPDLKHTLTQFISSPSRDGKSAKFSIYPTTSYANALWWKPLTPQPDARHLVYDLYYYITNPSASQALEFDVNQAVDNKWYVFGTECSGGKTWKIWDYYKRWVDTGISCSAGMTASKWHHLVWEFERTTDHRTRFVSVTVDGVKNYVNRYYYPKPNSSPKLTTSFQMDGNRAGTAYSTWLDNITLKYW